MFIGLHEYELRLDYQSVNHIARPHVASCSVAHVTMLGVGLSVAACLHAVEIGFSCSSDLVEKANRWLDQHPTTDIVSCETLEKKVCKVGDVGSDTVLFKPEFGTTAVYIKGLR